MELCSYFDVRMDPTMGFRTAREGLSAINYFLMHRYSWIPPPCNTTADWRQLIPTKKTTPYPGLVSHDMTSITGERLLIEPHPVQTKENYI